MGVFLDHKFMVICHSSNRIQSKKQAGIPITVNYSNHGQILCSLNKKHSSNTEDDVKMFGIYSGNNH